MNKKSGTSKDAADKLVKNIRRKPGSHGSLPRSPTTRSHASTSSSPSVTLLKQRNSLRIGSKDRVQRTGTDEMRDVRKEMKDMRDEVITLRSKDELN